MDVKGLDEKDIEMMLKLKDNLDEESSDYIEWTYEGK